MLKLAIQTNAWSASHHQDGFAQMLADIAAAGYQGFEIGAHRINLDDPQGFSALLAQHGLSVAGLHTHGALFDAQEMQAANERIARAADFAAAVGSAFVLFSGKPQTGKDSAQLAQEALALQHAGEIAQRAGVHLLYHNHYWEIEHDYAELRNLLDNTDPALVSLAMDVGWVHRAGGHPAQAAQRFIDRIRYFHFKDFRVKDFANDTWTELGSGYVDFPGVVEVIRQRELWVTYERDETMPDAPASARISRDYLRQLLGY